jgi:hypothetical protein
MPARAASNQPEISATVKLVTSGCCIKISNVVMVPNDKPNPRLDSNTTMLWIATMVVTVLGFAPMARRKPNS